MPTVITDLVMGHDKYVTNCLEWLILVTLA